MEHGPRRHFAHRYRSVLLPFFVLLAYVDGVLGAAFAAGLARDKRAGHGGFQAHHLPTRPVRRSTPSSSTAETSTNGVCVRPPFVTRLDDAPTTGDLLGSDKDWDAYASAVDVVLSSERTYQSKDAEEDRLAVREYLFRRERVVPINLPSLSEVADGGSEGGRGTSRSDALRSELDAQHSSLCDATGMTVPQLRIALRVLTYVGNYCAKKGEGRPLQVAWEKMKESGAVPRENVVSTYLYCLGIAAEEENDGTVHESGVGSGLVNLPGEVATFHDMLYQPTEKTLSLRIKSLVARGDATGAEALLESNDSKEGDLKLRTYLPVLQLYCDQGDISSALKLYKKMRHSPGVIFNAENYSVLLAAVAENGYFRSDSTPIDGAEDVGYSPACGPHLLDKLVSEMAEDVLEITSACARRLRNAFAKGFSGCNMAEKLEPVPPTEEMMPKSTIAGSRDLVADRVAVDGVTAVCPRTNATLRLIMLENDEKIQLHDTLLEMANAQYASYNEKLKARNHQVEERDDGYAAEQLSRFAQWIDGRDGEPFTAIVDGANVAFYGQGMINYHQVRIVVDALESMGENPLVIMPKKYTYSKFYIRRGFLQELDPEQEAIAQRLHQSEKMYAVPKRCLDDYYWMLASVSDQTKSRNGIDLDVPPNNEGRWPGLRPMLVSNDQMRDHKLELLQPRLFRRWVSSFITKYEFSPVVDDAWEERDVLFSHTEFFSREIQGNPSLGGGLAWHFPVSDGDWEKDDRFCLRLPSSTL